MPSIANGCPSPHAPTNFQDIFILCLTFEISHGGLPPLAVATGWALGLAWYARQACKRGTDGASRRRLLPNNPRRGRAARRDAGKKVKTGAFVDQRKRQSHLRHVRHRNALR